MTSKLIVNSIRHTGASADAVTMDASGNVTDQWDNTQWYHSNTFTYMTDT